MHKPLNWHNNSKLPLDRNCGWDRVNLNPPAPKLGFVPKSQKWTDRLPTARLGLMLLRPKNWSGNCSAEAYHPAMKSVRALLQVRS